MKDHTNNNANPALPPQWNDCTTCGAGITRKTDPTQQCRDCREVKAMQESRGIFDQYDQLAAMSDVPPTGVWSYGDANCPSTGSWG